MPESTRIETTEHTLESEKQNISSREVLERCKPEQFVSDEGITHTVFTFVKGEIPLRVVFYTKEELPFSEVLVRGQQPYVFGSEPWARKKEDVIAYKEKLRLASDPSEDAWNPGVLDSTRRESVFLVEKNPLSLMDFLLTLGVGDVQQIHRDRELLAQHRTSDTIEHMVDQIIAASVIDDAGEIVPVAQRVEGAEALLVLALSGDPEAARLLEHKYERLQKLSKDAAQVEHARRMQEMEGRIRSRKESKESDLDALKLEELAAVHMTSYVPEQNSDRTQWEILTTYDATGQKIPRITQHFTLNHPIESAGLYGNWTGMPMCMIMPMSTMIECNGMPAVLNTVDTFWEVSPGRRMQFPKDAAFLIRPGMIRELGVLSEQHGHEILYKTTHISPEDVQQLIGDMLDTNTVYASRELLTKVTNALWRHDEERAENVLEISEEDYKRILAACGVSEQTLAIGYHAQWDIQRDVLRELVNKTGGDVVDRILEEAGVRDRISEELFRRMCGVVEGYFVQQIKYRVIRDQIRAMGYTVHGGGMWAWDGDSFGATFQTQKLGLAIGVPVMPHNKHISFSVEEQLGRMMGELSRDSLTPAQYCQRIKTNDVVECSPQLRRLLYNVGAY